MSESGKDQLQDDIVAFDKYMEVVADTSILELTVDPSRTQPAPPTVTATGPVADGKRVDGGEVGQCKAIWRRIYWLLSSSVGLIILLVVYTLAGAALLRYTEYHREVEMHAELDAVRRRVVADIVNITTSRSRDGRLKSRDLSDVALADAVEALVVEYGDARLSLNPSETSPSWTFAGAIYFCGTVYTTIGQLLGFDECQ